VRRPAARLAACLSLLGLAGSAAPGAVPPLHVDPASAAAVWVSGHADDPLAAVVAEGVVARPQARWVTDPDPVRAARETHAYVSGAVAAAALPVVVLYAVPGRDCSGASAGGAEDWAAYRRWVSAVADALGDARAIVVLEPDALALQDCLTTAQARRRGLELATAVRTLGALAPAARVYLDGGHSDWHPPSVTAARLRDAGVDQAAGFATNVSNHQPTTAEVAYGREVRRLLGGDADQVVDTGRNGVPLPGADWCDPPGRRLGPFPTLVTEDPAVAYLWIKRPGEADGCAAPAGTFLPAAVAELAGS
jgi:endoglucanase